MKKILVKIGLVCGIIVLFFAGSCNEINKLPLNMPISIPFNKTGNNQQVSESKNYCLDSSQTYRDYKDRLKKLSFAKATWRTTSIKTNGAIDTIGTITGDITISLKSGTRTLFTYTLTNIKPATFIKNPWAIALTQAEIQAITTLIGDPSSRCFTGVITVNITSSTTPPYELVGYLDLLFEGEAEI